MKGGNTPPCFLVAACGGVWIICQNKRRAILYIVRPVALHPVILF